MITVNQLKMINIAPRGRITGDCVIRALAFICQAKAAFDAIESFVMNEQPHFRPDRKDSGGVYTDKLLKDSRKLFGHTFSRVSLAYQGQSLQAFTKYYGVGTYLVCNNNHAFVVKDGEIFDANPIKWHQPVRGAWKAEETA